MIMKCYVNTSGLNIHYNSYIQVSKYSSQMQITENNITVTHLYAHKHVYIHNTIYKYNMNINIMKIHCTN